MESLTDGSTGLGLRGWPHPQGSTSITLVGILCDGPTLAAVLCLSYVLVAPRGSNLWNLREGSQVPHALLDTVQAIPGLAGVAPAVAEECGAGMQGVEFTM